MRRPFTRSRARLRRIERGFEYCAYGLILCYAMFSVAHWLSERPSLRISDAHVIGAGAVDEDEILAILREPLDGTMFYRWIHKDNAILYPSSDRERKIISHSGWIKSAKVRAGRHTLTATIVEHVPAFHWCPDPAHAQGPIPDGACWYADVEGRVFVRSPEYSGYPFTRIISNDQGTSTPQGTFIMDPKKFSNIVEFIDALEQEGISVRSVMYIGGEDFRIRSDRPWDILWEMTDDVAASLNALELAVRDISEREKGQQPVREVDLRFDGKIFFR